jgi:branched-subunit amino acid transport protein
VDVYGVILGIALATYATRALAVFLLSRRLSPALERFLVHIPAAVFAALAIPPLLAPEGPFAPELPALAALFAVPIAWKTRQVFPTILPGLGAFWLLQCLTS